ncbi:histidine kinase [Paraglaciecola sp. 2405UD69-4]|uniref:histidine kinase n=1 Tax=Paraglaciecola sp. 2405UD69-4 TaxID=3391836 RepID=UPI0039C8DC2D
MSLEEDVTLNKLVHDARSPLNRISMNAEMIKLVLENDMPMEKGLQALDKIINACQECSQTLQTISQQYGDK